MIKGEELLLDLEEQMQTIKLPLMALKLDELYRSSAYIKMDKLGFLSELLAPEFKDKVTKTINNRLRTAHIIGTPCEITSCKDSKRRRYEPHGAPATLSSLRFIEEGQNVCILGASDIQNIVDGTDTQMFIPGVVAQHLDDHRAERVMIEHLVLLEVDTRFIGKNIHVVVFPDRRGGRWFSSLCNEVLRDLGFGVAAQFQVLDHLHFVFRQHLVPPLIRC